MLTSKRILKLLEDLPYANVPDWRPDLPREEVDQHEQNKMTTAAYVVMEHTNKILEENLAKILDPQLALYDKNAPLSEFAIHVTDFSLTLILREYEQILTDSLSRQPNEKRNFLVACMNHQAGLFRDTVNNLVWQYATLEPIENLLRAGESIKYAILTQVSMENNLYPPNSAGETEELLDLVSMSWSRNAVVRKIQSFDRFFLEKGTLAHIEYWNSLKSRPDNAKHLARIGYAPELDKAR